MPHAPRFACGVARDYRQRMELPASEGRTSQPVEWTASNGHIRSMDIPSSRKKYLVVSASLLTRS